DRASGAGPFLDTLADWAQSTAFYDFQRLATAAPAARRHGGRQMRLSVACALAMSVSVAVLGAALAQGTQPAQRPAAPPTAVAAGCPANTLGVARTLEIDTAGGPGFGFEHFRQHDFLKNNEIVLTFDDGPWLNNTPAVLKALADQCTKAIFFFDDLAF